MLRNPWDALPARPPFVLSQDWPFVRRFNRTAPKEVRIETSLLPEPFIGRLDAPVVLLAQNPGVKQKDFRWHRRPDFSKRLRSCLNGEDCESPFFHLHPADRGEGNKWWSRVTKPLLDQFGLTTVSENLLCVEFSPYHSRKFGHAHLRLPSQAFTFSVVRSAMRKGMPIFVSRAQRLWFGAIPELAEYKRCYQSSSRQNAIMSRANYRRGYGAIREAIRRMG